MPLSPSWILNGLDLTASPFMVARNESDHGTPASVTSVLDSLLVDGSIVLTDHHDNREIHLTVWMEAGGSGDLSTIAAAEAALDIAVSQPFGTLTFDPGDGVAAQCVFEVYAGSVEIPQDETADAAGLRKAVITLPARPFVRAAVETVFDAPPLPGEDPLPTVTITDGSSAAGFTLTPGAGGPSAVNSTAGPTASGGVVSGTAQILGNGSGNNRLACPASLSSDYGAGLLHVSGSWTIAKTGGLLTSARTGTVVVYIDNTVAWTGPASLTSSESTKTGTVSVDVPIPAGGITGSVSIGVGCGPTYVDLTPRIDSITADPPALDSAAVQSRQILIEGSDPTDLSLSVIGLDDDDTTALALGNQTLVNTAPAGDVSPFMRARSLSGLAADTTDTANALSGGWNALSGTPKVFPIPRSAIRRGDYMVYASVYTTAPSTGVKTIQVTLADQVIDGTYPAVASGAVWPQITTGRYVLVPVGILTLPDREATSGTADLSVTGTGTNWRIDDLIFCAVDGQTTLLDTSGSYDGHAVELVRLDAADADSPMPRIWFGTADGSYLTEAPPTAIQAFDQHQGRRGTLQASSVTYACKTSRLAGSYYRRYHTHVPA